MKPNLLNDKIKTDIITHYNACLPCECCGLIVKTAKGNHYHPCQNLADNTDQFILSPKDYLTAQNRGEILAIVHSHPKGDIVPSHADLIQMSLHGLPWVITNGKDFGVYPPQDYQAPLLGREYHHGVLDCYSLVRDYYQRELRITLPDYPRQDDWWEDKNHAPLYLDNFKTAGFVQIADAMANPKPHDVLLCRVGRTHHVNHAVVYMGDYELKSEHTPKAIGDIIIHHPHGRLSVRELLGESWRRRVAMVVRYRQLVSTRV